MPAAHFWFTGSALWTIGSFALFAILGFAGIANMTAAYRKIMFAGYALACVLFVLGWRQSAKQEEDSSRRDAEFSSFREAINKIAGSADVSLNQSANEIAKAVIAKLEPLRKEVEKLANPPRQADMLYQDNRPIARVAGVRQNGTSVLFMVVSADHEIDFSKEMEIQQDRIMCDKRDSNGSMGFGASVTINYPMVACHILGMRQ